MRKLIIGNWKMNGVSSDLTEIGLIAALCNRYDEVDSGICLPASLISRAASQFADLAIGGQDCHMATKGAHTGCVSAPMLIDAGAVITIIGHSERRAAQHESDADVRSKALTAWEAGLAVILCIGETSAERDAGRAVQIVVGQLENSLPDNASGAWLSIAYEPVWAIGTGRIPEDIDVAEMHAAIRAKLVSHLGEEGNTVRILYGGSMNGDNASGLLCIPDVDGGLIGGASLTAARFEPILAAAAELH